MYFYYSLNTVKSTTSIPMQSVKARETWPVFLAETGHARDCCCHSLPGPEAGRRGLQQKSLGRQAALWSAARTQVSAGNCPRPRGTVGSHAAQKKGPSLMLPAPTARDSPVPVEATRSLKSQYLFSSSSPRPVGTCARRPSGSTGGPRATSRSWEAGRRAALPPEAAAGGGGPSGAASAPKHGGSGCQDAGAAPCSVRSVHCPEARAPEAAKEASSVPGGADYAAPSSSSTASPGAGALAEPPSRPSGRRQPGCRAGCRCARWRHPGRRRGARRPGGAAAPARESPSESRTRRAAAAGAGCTRRTGGGGRRLRGAGPARRAGARGKGAAAPPPRAPPTSRRPLSGPGTPGSDQWGKSPGTPTATSGVRWEHAARAGQHGRPRPDSRRLCGTMRPLRSPPRASRARAGEAASPHCTQQLCPRFPLPSPLLPPAPHSESPSRSRNTAAREETPTPPLTSHSHLHAETTFPSHSGKASPRGLLKPRGLLCLEQAPPRPSPARGLGRACVSGRTPERPAITSRVGRPAHAGAGGGVRELRRRGQSPTAGLESQRSSLPTLCSVRSITATLFYYQTAQNTSRR